MAHTHEQADQPHGKAFIIGILLNAGYVAAEVIYGLLAHSSALLADAGHNAGDVLSLGLSWAAMAFALRKPNPGYTYGLKKMSILTAILNGLILFVTMAVIAVSASAKLQHPEKVSENIVIWIAATGIIINGITAWPFSKGREKDLNIKAVFLHMAADAAISLGVLLAGVVIKFTGWYWLDPAVCLVIVVIVLWETWELMKDSVNLALDAVPAQVSLQSVSHYLKSIQGVDEVYDLHIWGMSTTQTALSAHLLIPSNKGDDRVLDEIKTQLNERFGITHPTIQIVHRPYMDSGQLDCLQN